MMTSVYCSYRIDCVSKAIENTKGVCKSQSYSDRSSFNMTRFLIATILLASLIVAGTWAIDGVKGGHRPRYPTSANQYGGNNNSVLCYKTVP